MVSRLLTLDDDAAPERLDRVLAGAWGDFSRSRLQALIRAGHVTLDEAVVVDPAQKVAAGAAITLVEPPPAEPLPRPEAIPLTIVYEDDAVVVLDKPAGLVVHPAAGHETGTLVNALIAHCGTSLSGIGGVRRPGIVHRIDKDTSGLLVVAKTDAAHKNLSAQFADHGRTGALERAYLAFVWGVPQPERGTIEAALARHTSSRERMAITAGEHGRHAITHYAVEDRYGDTAEPVASLVRCTLETGRTHQIRVHMAHLRHPLIGDALYGAGFRTKVARLPEAARSVVAELCRQALHATLLQFEHPSDGRLMRFESDLPPDLARLRESLEEA
jgi:23S rRNA pseudouridine1911/1915/1917 synthase